MSTPALMKGLPWTVLRLHRAALIVWGAFVVLAIGVLAWTITVTADTALRELAACELRGACGIASTVSYSERIGFVGLAVGYAFLAVAAWTGAALIGRELENGTAALAWTQSVSPARWLAAKLAMPALLLTLGGTALVLAFRWGWSAHRELMGDSWDFGHVFLARGPAMVAYTLCALAVGALVAIAVRRPLPALGLSLAAMFALNFVLDTFRWDLWPAVTRTGATELQLPDNVRGLQNGVIIDGRRTADVEYWACDGTPAEVQRCVDDLGVTGYYAVYHPQSHYWPLHLVETGIVLAVTAAATTAAFILLRRRTV
ncbi:hypothetical protein [Streptomyces sp. NPDC002845]